MITKKKLESELSTLAERIQALENAQKKKGIVLSEIEDPSTVRFVVNTNKKRFHRPNCGFLNTSYEENLTPVSWTREDCIEQELKPCMMCKP